VETVLRLEPSFGGINLKDIRAPEGLAIYDRLREQMGIPVFHENLDSTAVVAAAALINALELVDKKIDTVWCPAGNGAGCARLLLSLGVREENLLAYDVNGLLHPDREDLHEYQRGLAREDPARRLEEGLRGADVFLGASVGGVLSPEMVRAMARFPVVLALASPEPEIDYEAARASRQDVAWRRA
jgi:malate dehydrogenase (oxaloacetate-decarboxylating)(NADP+)